MTLLPLELGSLSGFRLPYPFHQRQRLRDFLSHATHPISQTLSHFTTLYNRGSALLGARLSTLRTASTQARVDAVTAALPSPPLPPLPPSLYVPPPVEPVWLIFRVLSLAQTSQEIHCLSTLGSRYEVGESSIARPTGGRGIDYGFVSTDLYALLEDAQDSRDSIS
ncbi:hypothetical protein Tco_0088969 [Tanacetum coccineum]